MSKFGFLRTDILLYKRMGNMQAVGVWDWKTAISYFSESGTRSMQAGESLCGLFTMVDTG
jgi:hypothetical protein